mgnify:FL=1
MKQDTIQFYIYPLGIADSLGQDDFVLVRNKLGSLDTKFVSDLVEGDYYCKRIPKPLPPRNAEDILKYIADNCLTFKYLFSEEDEYGYERCKAIELYQDNEPISMTNYSENCIREAVEPIMDMDEL